MQAPHYEVLVCGQGALSERAMGMEPTALCLGIKGPDFPARLPRSQIRKPCLSATTKAPETSFGHLPERVPSI